MRFPVLPAVAFWLLAETPAFAQNAANQSKEFLSQWWRQLRPKVEQRAEQIDALKQLLAFFSKPSLVLATKHLVADHL